MAGEEIAGLGGNVTVVNPQSGDRYFRLELFELRGQVLPLASDVGGGRIDLDATASLIGLNLEAPSVVRGEGAREELTGVDALARLNQLRRGGDVTEEDVNGATGVTVLNGNNTLGRGVELLNVGLMPTFRYDNFSLGAGLSSPLVTISRQGREAGSGTVHRPGGDTYKDAYCTEDEEGMNDGGGIFGNDVTDTCVPTPDFAQPGADNDRPFTIPEGSRDVTAHVFRTGRLQVRPGWLLGPVQVELIVSADLWNRFHSHAGILSEWALGAGARWAFERTAGPTPPPLPPPTPPPAPPAGAGSTGTAGTGYE